jgi:alpha-D-xyloside xylohydrolase
VASVQFKRLVMFLRGRLRHPRLTGKLGELEPNVYFGYSDHPLDRRGTPIVTMFTAPAKMISRRAACVLSVSFRERDGNSFRFDAKAYDIFRLRDFDRFYEHRYNIGARTRFVACTLQLDLLREGVYRLRLARGDSVPPNATPMLAGDIADAALEVSFEETLDAYILATAKLRLKIFKEAFRIEIFDGAGRRITESGSKTKNEFPNTMDAFPLGFIRDRACRRSYGVESFTLHPGEAVYGLGEQFGPLNKVGQTIGLWHWEGVGNSSGRSYKNIPFFLSTQGYGVFVNESRPITYWVGSRELCKNQIAIEGELVDYFFFAGKFKEILGDYTALTGRAPLPPRFSFGVWISRCTFASQAEVMQVAETLRDLRFPCDVLHIDFWFDQDWRCDWRFGKRNFPDPEGMFRRLRELGFRVSLWQNPYVVDETDTYAEARELVAENNAPFVFAGLFPAHPIDFSNPAAVKWYQEKLASLFALGASVIKADFGEGIEPAMRFKEYDGRAMHNLYPLLYNKAAFEVTQRTFGRGLIWARSAYAGSQRYPVHWSGDNSSNFENMLCSLRGGLSLGLSGFTFWSMDTGGFVGTPSDVLYVRWTQLSTFQSHIRFHGCAPKYREPWSYGAGAQAIVRRYLELRYRLLPYLYTEAQVAARQGLPLLAPLVLEFQDDRNVRYIEDQFFCGRNILVAPIATEEGTRKVYLPEGRWYDYWTGEEICGPCWIERTVPLEEIPIFLRAGSILPLAPVAQCVDEQRDDELTLKVYPDTEGAAAYTILDDNGRVQITAQLQREELTLSVDPEPSTLTAELPGGRLPSVVRINGRR